jgi:hypothetical protein
MRNRPGAPGSERAAHVEALRRLYRCGGWRALAAYAGDVAALREPGPSLHSALLSEHLGRATPPAFVTGDRHARKAAA